MAQPAWPRGNLFLLLIVALLFLEGSATAAKVEGSPGFPPPLSSYTAPADASLGEVLAARIRAEPFNLVGTIIFALAILHTFMAPSFLRLAHKFEQQHSEKLQRAGGLGPDTMVQEVSFKAGVFHFFGEIEAVFGIWVVPLMIALTFSKGWLTARDYLGERLDFTEPVFVVVIMTMAASRPILKFAEQLMASLARLGQSSPAAWWFSILTVGPLLGSFITEPAAMTISALLLADKFYRRQPGPVFAYATLGLLFVNISIGGTLTHFAAPPVLMVASKWNWGWHFMLTHFGWKAVTSILVANLLMFLWFRRQFQNLIPIARPEFAGPKPDRPVPLWITSVHILFLVWTVWNNHFPTLFVGGFLFYLAFAEATEHHQAETNLRPALLVGFFLAGLVVHGGLQGWWIGPVLSRLTELPLFLGAVGLTAFNDNAAVTYLATFVPGLTERTQYAVVAGAVIGGGLTVIANAPNPAGQSILSRFFPDGVSPMRLFLGALVPTIITTLVFLLLH